MDKTAIKNFAIQARKDLIAGVKQKAYEYGIDEKTTGNESPTGALLNGRILTSEEQSQRNELLNLIKTKGYYQVMEEVAYTWFNRFIALRFMEVNEYLPSRICVFTNDKNAFEPEILSEALHLELEGLDKVKVIKLLEVNQTEELYKYLLITQCNDLNSALPEMFEKIQNYTELLFPNNLLKDGSVLSNMITNIPLDDWKEAVEIIGWLYQYYNTEVKDETFALLNNNVKITKERIPAATQLFTPDWIVRYMVENSLGRLWIEGHPSESLKSNWKYYLDEAEQEPEVVVQLDKIRADYAKIKPEEIKVIDPCMGSGHILVYAFDVLMQIYIASGYSERDAAKSILQNNLFGLDIDDRAYQLSYFAVMMKARKYCRTIFSDGICPNLYSIQESNFVTPELIDYVAEGEECIKYDLQAIVETLHDAKEYGSIINIPKVNFVKIFKRFKKIQEIQTSDLQQMVVLKTVIDAFIPLIHQVQIMAQKYDVVITNPPYMGISNGNSKLNQFAKTYYPESKSDFSTMFMERCLNFCTNYGFASLINIPVWMSKSSFESLRCKLLKSNTFINMLHFGRGVFGSDFGTTAFVLNKTIVFDYLATFRQLYEELGNVDSLEQKEKWFFEGKGYFTAKQQHFLNIASYPIAYWSSAKKLHILNQCEPLKKYADARKGLTTGDNEIYARLWFEVGKDKFSIFVGENTKWFPMTKGGEFRRWFGNNDYIVNWENNGYEICNFKDENGKLKSRPQNVSYYFRECISWNDTTASGKIAFRYQPAGFIPNASGPCVYAERDLLYLFGLLNSIVSQEMLEILAPNMKFEVGQMALVPIVKKTSPVIDELVMRSINIAKSDWDSFESSWNFEGHPLISIANNAKNNEGIQISLKEAYDIWSSVCTKRFCEMKDSEEALNRIFIEIYGLKDEISPEVDNKNVTIHKADLLRDIKSLISNAVGCIFGRFSLDVPGLVYAGDNWAASVYKTIIPDQDNIIPICDEEYFNDDIVGRVVNYIKITFGAEYLEENLKFIAAVLNGKDAARDVIRNYFLTDFYKDHCSIYSAINSGKRPIYWLFDSGKKNGFKALIYMHRYKPDLLAIMRTDYVHEQQERYRTQLQHLEASMQHASPADQAKINKQIGKLKDQSLELLGYEEKIHHLADQMIDIDLDDGVKVNYAKFQDVLAPIR